MKKLMMTSTMVVGLLFAAASCGSDDKASTSTSTDSVVSVPSSDATTGSVDVPSTGGATAASVDLSGLGDLQAQVVTMTLSSAAAAGVTIDGPCFTAVAAQLSDADAQLIIDAGPEGSPTLSAEGEALGTQASACVVTADSVTATT